MDTELAQLYLKVSEPLDNSVRSQIDNEILERYENPESFLEILTILSKTDAISIARRSAAVGLKKVIKNHIDFLLSDLKTSAEPVLNALLQILFEEKDEVIPIYIITSLSPAFETIGDSWEQLTNLFSTLFESNDMSNINKGLMLMADFIPYASIEFVSEHSSLISQFIQAALSSSKSNIQNNGILLFSSLLQTQIPISEFAETFYDIFKRSLEIFHQFLLNGEIQISSDASGAFSKILKCDPLFAPPAELYQMFLQILCDSQIPVETHHFPLFPIGKLLKKYGEDLQEFFPQSIEIFLTISSSQFNDAGYDCLDGSESIIPLFEYMVNSINDPNEFINVILQNVCSDDSIAESFASVCAIIGLIESSNEQIGNHCQRIIDYCVDRAKLGNSTLTQAILKAIYDLVKEQSESLSECASDICNFLFQVYQAHQDEEISKYSLDAITYIFYEYDLDRSFVIEYVPKFIQSYQEAAQSLKPNFMQCLSGSILACQEDSIVFADQLIPIVIEGAQATGEAEFDNRVCCIEALGDFLAFIPEKCESIYDESIKLILTASAEEHFALRSIGLLSLINIIKYSEGELLVDFAPYAAETAINSMSLKIPKTEDIYAEDDSSYSTVDIVVYGFRLFAYLLEYNSEVYERFNDSLMPILQEALNSVARVQIEALKVAAFIIPEKTGVFDNIIKILTEPLENDDDEVEDDDIIVAAFNCLEHIFKKSKSDFVDESMEKFMEISFACLAHKLPFQEESLEYNKKVTKSLISFLTACIHEKFDQFPADNFIQIITDVINEVEEKEAFKLLELFSVFVIKGGPVNEEIALFGLNKLQLCDFSHGKEPIIFVYSLIRKQPNILEDKIDQIIPFFIQQLSAEPVNSKHYWPTIMSIILTMLALILSEPFKNIEAINSDQCISLILAKLPPKDYFEDALFIYETIITMIKEEPKRMNNFTDEILRVFVQTLAFSQKNFEKLDFTRKLILQMIATLKFFFSKYPQLEEQVPEVLNNDKVKINHFIERVKKFEEAE